jgi:hypothetical protein
MYSKEGSASKAFQNVTGSNNDQFPLKCAGRRFALRGASAASYGIRRGGDMAATVKLAATFDILLFARLPVKLFVQ